MSDLALFLVGSIVFLITAWASVAFGVQRMHELHLKRMDRPVREEGLTEIYLDPDQPGDKEVS